MNCQTIKSWLLAAHRSERLPVRLVRHLEECSSCRKLRVRLLKVDELTAELLTIPDNPQAHAAIEARITLESPQPREQLGTALPMPANIGKPRRRRRVNSYPIVAPTVAVFILAFGWLIGRYSASRQTSVHTVEIVPGPERIVVRQKSVEEKTTPIVVRIASLTPRIVGDNTPTARLDTLNLLADELRAECLRLASRGQIDELPRLAALHDRVLRAGVSEQILRFPEGRERDAAINRVMRKMERVEEEVSAVVRGVLPSVAERLKPLTVSARAVARGASGGAVADVPKSADLLNSSALEGLVSMVVKLSHEDAPLPRAQSSAELGQMLAHATVLLTAAGKPQYSTQMGEYLDTVMAYGVADNLDTVEADDMKGELKEKIAKVRESAGEASTVIERNLEQAEEPEAIEGLQKALDASREGQERATKGGKGKGPPWNRKDKNMPPGWQKKN